MCRLPSRHRPARHAGRRRHDVPLGHRPGRPPPPRSSSSTAASRWSTTACRSSPPLPFGLFKIKTRIGRGLAQHVILLDSGRPPLAVAQIAKPASSVLPPVRPAGGRRPGARPAGGAGPRTAPAGEGDGKQATLMVMARAASSAEVPQQNIAPWRDVQVVDADDNLVISMRARRRATPMRTPRLRRAGGGARRLLPAAEGGQRPGHRTKPDRLRSHRGWKPTVAAPRSPASMRPARGPGCR